MATITAWITANQGAAAIILGVLLLAGFINKDKFAELWAKITGKATDTADGAKAKLSAAGDDLKNTFESVVADIGGVKDDVGATALDLGTRALYRRYVKLYPDDAQAITDTFQQLSNINAKLKPVTPPSVA